MIERRAAAEIVPFDERHGKPSLRGVVCDRQAVDAAADDEQVEPRRRQSIDIANH